MNGYDILRRVREMVIKRCAEIEGEKILYPERIEDLRLESADMNTILDCIDDVDESNRDKPELLSTPKFDLMAEMDEVNRLFGRSK